MKTNLNLDFSLNSSEKRVEFCEAFLSKGEVSFNNSSLEKIADYILWGDKTNPNSDGVIGVESKVWKKNAPESLEALQEDPTFSEATLSPIGGGGAKFRVPREKFSRQEALQKLSPSLIPSIESLWREIDTLDLLISFYEQAHKPNHPEIRSSLLSKFSEKELLKFEEESRSIPQYLYLKMRHLLKDKRCEQYTFKDTYSSRIMRRTPQIPVFPEDNPIEILPFPFSPKFFPSDDSLPSPLDFSEEDLARISEYLWHTSRKSPYQFNFENEEHVASLIQYLSILPLTPEFIKFDSSLPELRDVFEFYSSVSNLTPAQRSILSQKIFHIPNADIAISVNHEFGKTYSANYISTIFHQKIIPQICATASLHREIIENIFFPENFKKCNDCGKMLLLNNINFCRKSKSKDGYSARCKICEHKRRLKNGQ